MSSLSKNLSEFSSPLPDGKNLCIGIVCSEWNSQITSALLNGAVAVLKQAMVAETNIKILYVPGAFELPFGAQKLAQDSKIDGVICIGCVINGETPHFNFICGATANGIMEVGLKYNKPVVFGVLTTTTMLQAEDRAGGKHGNKGDEAAYSLLQMLTL